MTKKKMAQNDKKKKMTYNDKVENGFKILE